MELIKITEKDFDFYYSLLEKDFCIEERKIKAEELESLNNKKFNAYFIFDDNQIVGYFTCWEFKNFVFGEHFAILEEFRNKGYGSMFFNCFLAQVKKMFVFEIERPTDLESKRRLKFYKKFDLWFNEFDYCQPSYHKDGEEIPMIFVSYPEKLSLETYNEIVKTINEEVYKIKQ